MSVLFYTNDVVLFVTRTVQIDLRDPLVKTDEVRGDRRGIFSGIITGAPAKCL